MSILLVRAFLFFTFLSIFHITLMSTETRKCCSWGRDLLPLDRSREADLASVSHRIFLSFLRSEKPHSEVNARAERFINGLCESEKRDWGDPRFVTERYSAICDFLRHAFQTFNLKILSISTRMLPAIDDSVFPPFLPLSSAIHQEQKKYI